MIKLRNSDNIEIKFETTIFPDGTSQVWRLEEELLSEDLSITWVWEGKEQELFHLIQLVDLIRKEHPKSYIVLFMPYCPYARQDKEVSNDSTFALTTFNSIIHNLDLDEVIGFDLHSKNKYITNLDPNVFQLSVIEKFQPDLFFFPDKGAYNRYSKLFTRIDNMIIGEKVRNQETGNIVEYKINYLGGYQSLKDKKVLIVDDLVDGGATFVLAAKELKEYNVKEIGLCVSHGIFSKGFEEMKQAGISQFFYTNSLLKNKDGYKVWE